MSPQNEILLYIHCAKCVEEWQNPMHKESAGESRRSYARIEAGWTKAGLQIRCVRHGLNICHIDFEGHKHPVDLSAGMPEADDGDATH